MGTITKHAMGTGMYMYSVNNNGNITTHASRKEAEKAAGKFITKIRITG